MGRPLGLSFILFGRMALISAARVWANWLEARSENGRITSTAAGARSGYSAGSEYAPRTRLSTTLSMGAASRHTAACRPSWLFGNTVLISDDKNSSLQDYFDNHLHHLFERHHR